MIGAFVTLLLSLLFGTVLDASTGDDAPDDDAAEAQDDPVVLNTDLMDIQEAAPPEADVTEQAPEPAAEFDLAEDVLLIEYEAEMGPDLQLALEETESGTDVILQGAVIASLHGVTGMTEEDVLLRPVSG